LQKVLFLYLKAFSLTGGIEKFNRSFLKALHELSVDGIIDADAYSPYDTVTDEKYFPRLRFSGFGGTRIFFVIRSIVAAYKYNTIIIGHINLAVIAYIIKTIRPNIHLIIITHGIEVWKEQKGYKKQILQMADTILSVSSHTKNQLLHFNSNLQADKIKVFPNTLDPYFKIPKEFVKSETLQNRYAVNNTNKVLITVTRLSFSEKYKGYDNVVKVLPSLLQKNDSIKYLICGKADIAELNRMKTLINQYNLNDSVKLIGFVNDDELIQHYLMADAFVMPSKKEGFGIVFIEALACGVPVIAGNKDGSVDALQNGALGKLIDPDSEEELEQAILETLQQKNTSPQILQQNVLNSFGFEHYKKRLQNALQLF
jgi:phosphatidyl-myo-inositol dimannoside synthase